MKIVETKELRKIYGSGEKEVRALDGVNLSMQKGEFVAIIGSSGSGKTTLLNMIGGLDSPTSGEVIIYGVSLEGMDQEELTVFRRRNIGFVFQNYNLVPVLNVYENIVLPLKLDGKKVDQEFLQEIALELGIEEKLYQMPNALSGGQQQRVAIARALITKPVIILADEPTGNLDSKTSGTVISLMRKMVERFHQTMSIVTHNEEIAALADRIIRIEDGKVCSNMEKG
ncbi:MAG: ABC transporter ATP-binding protein [Lachnospiraceae bacterium]|nr:ABC transporter ATP-binding protein [Lachnospiraceae bacterium]